MFRAHQGELFRVAPGCMSTLLGIFHSSCVHGHASGLQPLPSLTASEITGFKPFAVSQGEEVSN